MIFLVSETLIRLGINPFRSLKSFKVSLLKKIGHSKVTTVLIDLLVNDPESFLASMDVTHVSVQELAMMVVKPSTKIL